MVVGSLVDKRIKIITVFRQLTIELIVLALTSISIPLPILGIAPAILRFRSISRKNNHFLLYAVAGVSNRPSLCRCA